MKTRLFSEESLQLDYIPGGEAQPYPFGEDQPSFDACIFSSYAVSSISNLWFSNLQLQLFPLGKAQPFGKAQPSFDA